jgi:DNA-binding MarR family transcriptional regulator
VSDPVWLTDEEMETWLAFIGSSRMLQTELDRQLQRDAGIPHSWFGMLALLADQPGRRARQSDLAVIADFSLSRLSHAVARMEERGWVSREPDPADRRASLVTLTDAGLSALTGAAPGHAAAVRRLFLDRITDEQAAALRAAGRSILQGLGTFPPGLVAPSGIEDCD